MNRKKHDKPIKPTLAAFPTGEALTTKTKEENEE